MKLEELSAKIADGRPLTISEAELLLNVAEAAKDMREHYISRQGFRNTSHSCASCALRVKGLSEALGALDSK